MHKVDPLVRGFYAHELFSDSDNKHVDGFIALDFLKAAIAYIESTTIDSLIWRDYEIYTDKITEEEFNNFKANVIPELQKIIIILKS